MISHSRVHLREKVGKSNKILTIPIGGVVELIDIIPDVKYSNMDTTWLEVKYNGKTGYSYAGFFDTYENSLQQDIVNLSGIQTADPYDAKQYILVDGKKKYNQCGELACAYILREPLKEILRVWGLKSPNLVSRIFKGSRDRGTGAHTLINLLESFGVDGSQTISSFFKDELLGRAIFTAPRVAKALEDHSIIMGVRIGRSGYVGEGRINHWVVLDSIDIYGKQGMCTIFNPYMNRYEVYSWAELMKYNAGIDGVVVPVVVEKEDEWVDSIKH